MTTNDPTNYGPVPSRVDHAVHLVTEVHGYFDTTDALATQVVKASRGEDRATKERMLKAAALLQEAANLLKG